MKNKLLKLIHSRKVRIAVIGLGYVGLPLAVGFAEAGIKVVGIDIDSQKIDSINSTKESMTGISAERISKVLSRSEPKLVLTTDYNLLYDVEVAIICVPTPLQHNMDPDLSYVEATSNEIAKRLHRGMLIVLESTTYPGTTEEVLLPLFGVATSEGQKFRAGKDYFLAFSPERIDPGRTDYTICNTPKVVGGVTENCTEVAADVYSLLVDSVVRVSSPKTAEMVKLLENTFRAVNVGMANEFALMCNSLGVDVWEVIDAAATKPFGYTPFYPGPGLGGHCIPVDPHYLSWKMKKLDYDTKFINLASDINLSMPEYVVSKIVDALGASGQSLKNSKILVLGVAYKPDVSDIRESPGLRLISRLIEAKAIVSYHDMFVPEINLQDRSMFTVDLTEKELSLADCVVIATDHSYYPIDTIVDCSSMVLDTRNATKKYQGKLTNVIKI